ATDVATPGARRPGLLLLCRRGAAVSYAAGSYPARRQRALGQRRNTSPDKETVMIAFSSIEDFLAMDGHGGYVRASYGIAVASLGWNAVHPLLQRRRFLRRQKRRALGEATPWRHHAPGDWPCWSYLSAVLRRPLHWPWRPCSRTSICFIRPAR